LTETALQTTIGTAREIGCRTEDAMEHRKVLERILRGVSDADVNFEEMRHVLLRSGFKERIRGSHHIFAREGVEEILNLQPKAGRAKAYQVKQVRGVLLKYKLGGEVDVQVRGDHLLER